jgi:hypothetical protein
LLTKNSLLNITVNLAHKVQSNLADSNEIIEQDTLHALTLRPPRVYARRHRLDVSMGGVVGVYVDVESHFSLCNNTKV